MRTLVRNKRPLWYANPTGSEWVTDEHGLKTGDKKITYGEPVPTKMNVSISNGADSLGSQGRAVLDQYGILTTYTHRAVTDEMDCGMNEESIVWFGITPTDDEENPVPHNFKVVSKASSLNHLVYYLREVKVS